MRETRWICSRQRISLLVGDPISIFGSLGIVRASFNILVASVDIQQYRFLGARKLNNGGFDAGGVVAPMIALDPHHPKRFLAESRLEKMLSDEHIENAEDLKVTWGKGIAWWNFPTRDVNPVYRSSWARTVRLPHSR